MALSTTSASALSLSPLVGGSKQFIITLQEGVNTIVPSDMLCDTASRSDVGVATALTLLSYDQVPEISGGISFIRAGQSQTGNSGVIPIGGRALESYAGSSGYSTGTSTILVASAGNGEPTTMTYDTRLLGEGTLTAPTGSFSVTYLAVATEADLAAADFTQANGDSDIVVANVAADPASVWRIAVRKNSALYETILSNYTETAGEDSMRLLFDYNQTINAKFSSQTLGAPFEFVPSFTANTGIWTAFTVFASNPSPASAVNRVIFGTPTPTDGQASTAGLREIRHESTKRRAVKCVFNATQVVSSSVSHYGGGIASR
jgi:hypothetical protein